MPHPKIDCHLCPTRCLGPLADLSDEMLETFNAGKTTRVYYPCQIIFYEDNKPFGIFCVETGKIKLTKYTTDGKTYITRVVKAGDLLGYRAFLANQPYAATAEVLEEATICFIGREIFNQAIKKFPVFSLRLMEQLGSDLARAENQARDMAYKSVPERLAEMLLAMKDNFGKVRADGSTLLDIQLSRDEMASMLGTTLETTVRTLTRFKQIGLITTDKKQIVIKDISGLAQYITSP